MGTNLSGWGYPLSQTSSFSSYFPCIAIDDVSSTSDPATTVKDRIRGDFSLFSLVLLPLVGDEDDDATAVDSSPNIGSRQYTAGLFFIIGGVELRT